MGNNVSIKEALIIAGFSIVVVFIGLSIIALLIGGLKRIGGGKKEGSQKPMKDLKDKRMEENKIKIVEDSELIKDEELIAVLSAAVAVSMGVSIPEIKIKKIKRIPENTPVWAAQGMREQLSRKL